ncbi:MAG TPA: DUF2232 domain-containing protein [Longimicrobiales bacterium]
MAERPGRGWGAVAVLTLVAATLSLLGPLLLVLVPLALLFIAVPPRRPGLAALGCGLLAVALLYDRGADTLWFVSRGWALVAGAWFVIAVVALPRARFLARGLAAVAATAATAALCLVAIPGGWPYLDWLASQRYHRAAAELAARWGAAAAAEGWTAPVALAESIREAAELQILLHPALLALASLAGLGVAWWGFRRLTVREERPLAPFREFRFRDELVWVLIGGLLLVVLPLGDPAVRAGSNLLAFMGALYALRGAAVVLAVLGPPGFGSAMLGIVALFFLPMVMAASVLVGVTDTWLDLRARRSPVRPGS